MSLKCKIFNKSILSTNINPKDAPGARTEIRKNIFYKETEALEN